MNERVTGMESIVETERGAVAGDDCDTFIAFRGIPYAQPPVGPRRFRPPVELDRWDGARSATRYGPIAPQHVLPGIMGELFSPSLTQGDDCLSLNVWTPERGGARLPVLVWIHGGGFMLGASSDPLIDKASFAQSGIVVVTMNYRLGALGFLELGGDASNLGLLDQLSALTWVQDNIAAFGGDPDNVTVGGQSSGAMCVSALLGAPSAKGMFRRAIAQSGAAHHVLTVEDAHRLTREFIKAAGISTADELRTWPSSKIVAVQESLCNDLAITRDTDRFGEGPAASTMAFQPVIGGEVLPEHPLEAVAAGAATDVDLLIGHTRDEFRLQYGLGYVTADMDAVVGTYEGVFGSASEALERYRANRPDADEVGLLAALETDRMFRIPAVRLADAHVGRNARTWFYRFSWESRAFDGRVGAGHALDLPFTFDALDNPLSEALTGAGAPTGLARAMHRSWVSFVATGDPGTPELPAWPRHDPDERPVLDFGDTIEVLHDPLGDEVALWRGVR